MRLHPFLLHRCVIADVSIALSAVERINRLPPLSVGLDDIPRMIDAIGIEPSRGRVGFS
jgi:hypothetical protein